MSQTTIPGTVPYAPARQYVVNANIFPYSIVGAINSHTVRLPHMPLGTDSVVGVDIYRTK
jgi:hypothetical protein